jgi:hypothetical protein
MHEAMADGQDTEAALAHFAGTLSPDEAAVLRSSLDALDQAKGASR